MGFFSDITRGVEDVATGGLAEFGRSDPFGFPGGGQYLPYIGAAGLTALTGNPAIGSGMLNFFSAQQQNQAAMRNASQAQQFSAAQVLQQEEFQTMMSSTAHQREVKDLEAAGLNPMLSVNAGASTPSGGAGSGVNAPVVPQIGPAVSSAMDSIRLLQDLKESNSRVIQNTTGSDLNVAKSFLTDQENRLTDQNVSIMRKQNRLLDSELGVVGAHPAMAGWLKVLADRGIGLGSAMGALSLLGE